MTLVIDSSRPKLLSLIALMARCNGAAPLESYEVDGDFDLDAAEAACDELAEDERSTFVDGDEWDIGTLTNRSPGLKKLSEVIDEVFDSL